MSAREPHWRREITVDWMGDHPWRPMNCDESSHTSSFRGKVQNGKENRHLGLTVFVKPHPSRLIGLEPGSLRPTSSPVHCFTSAGPSSARQGARWKNGEELDSKLRVAIGRNRTSDMTDRHCTRMVTNSIWIASRM